MNKGRFFLISLALLPMFNNKKGQSLIELLVVMALAAVLMPPILTGFMSSREGRAQQKQRSLATVLMKQTQEEIRNIREHGWSYLAPTGTYYPSLSGSSWILVPGSTTVNGFTKQVLISDVYRSISGAIVISPTPGTLDPSTKIVTTIISWVSPRPTSINQVTYLTRFRDNLPHTETTKTQFQAGTFNKTTAINTLSSSIPDDGEVTMGLGGLSDWCNPNLSITAFDLPKSGVANAISAIQGKVFAGTGENAAGVSFANIAISNTNPPTSSQTGTFDGYKTNAVFGESNYAYLATDNNGKEVVIIDLNSLDPVTKKYSEAGYFDVPGNTNADSIFVFGNLGFTTAQSKLYTFDLSSKSGSRGNALGSVDLAGTGKKVIVKNISNVLYAFVASGSTSNQLQTVQISSDGKNLSVIGQTTVDAGNGVDIFINDTGTRAYLATSYVSGKNEFFIIDVSSKTGNQPVLGSYSTSGMNPKGVTVVTGNRALIVGTSEEEYQAINISQENSPTRCGGINIDSGVNGISSVLESDNDAYSYIITGDTSSELKIIEGGPGGSFGYNGTFESAPFDSGAGFAHAFNRFTANVSIPSQTSINMQIAVANAVDNSCTNANYTFIGPDPDNPTGSFFQPTGTVINGVIPMTTYQNYSNPGRCFKYKAYLNTPDSSRTPSLLDMTVNYSP